MTSVVLSSHRLVNFLEGGGHFWVYMQYAAGLRALGCEVVWLESFRASNDPGLDARRTEEFARRLAAYGIDSPPLLFATANGGPAHALGDETEAHERIAAADLFLNFNYAIDPGLLARARRTALVDIDPGLFQHWVASGELAPPPHDVWFTTGETVGTPAARFPDLGIAWERIRPPVALEEWPYVANGSKGPFTTVSSWWANEWVSDGGEYFDNNKRAAFLEFVDLPRHTEQPLELAIFLTEEEPDREDRRLLEERGWRVRHATEVAGTPDTYRRFVQSSRGEFSPAKRSCLRFQNAWISDRTLCYLASGRPAVVEHTGPSSVLPDREGLFRVRTVEAAAAALDEIAGDYERHSRAARALVEEHFDAEQILTRILERACGY